MNDAKQRAGGRRELLPLAGESREGGAFSGLRRHLFLLSILVCLLSPVSSRAADVNPVTGSRQVVLVLARDWDSRNGEMRLFERGQDGAWSQSGETIPVMLGRNGLGWGREVNGDPGEGPVKKEGDGKAPAGIFRLGFVFGYAPEGSRKLTMPYRQMTSDIECVDDGESPLYNQVIDTRKHPERGWKSFEQMRREDDLYSLGVTVDHNTAPPAPGGGSCIFLHVWRGPDSPTSGCTSMAISDMERLTGWLDASKNPLLVQLPRSERDAFTKRFGTP